MADLATYQAAANSIYDPQQANESASLAATNNANIATLEGQKGQINTDYGQAVQNLRQTTQQNTGQINQLYTQRLGGNFSGLQGNDLGQMFSRAAQDQTNIETNRANKLNGINTEQTNAKNIYNTTNNSLVGKYSALKNQYANTAYADANKQEQDNYYKQANLQLAQQRNGIAAQNANNAAASKLTAGYGVKSSSTGGYSFHGANGVPVTLAKYASVTGASIDDLLASSTDPNDAVILKKWQATQGDPQKLNQLANEYKYVFGG